MRYTRLLPRLPTFAMNLPSNLDSTDRKTAEPDGSFKEYMLRVHPELRPMLDGGQFGEPQALTAHNAVASTFGLRGEQYAPIMES